MADSFSWRSDARVSFCATALPPMGAGTAGMPPEIMHTILQAGGPWSQEDVLALSQSAPEVNRHISALQPDTYQKAHQPTLHRAFKNKRFNFHNPRAKAVLGALNALHLLGSPDPRRTRRTCDPATVEPARLEQIVRAADQARVLHLGALTHSLVPLWQLGQAGLKVGQLTTLSLEQTGALDWGHLDWLHSIFGQMPALQVLHMPQRLAGRSSTARFCFAPLGALRELTWEIRSGVIAGAMNVSDNPALEVFKFAPCAPTPMNVLGLVLPPEELTLNMPKSRLKVLHLGNVSLTEPMATLLCAPPWQDTLVELHLAVDFLATTVDLSRHTALVRLHLTPRCINLQQLTLPPPGKLEELHVQGDQMAPLLHQLGATPAPRLRRFALSLLCATAPWGPIPWANLPNVEAFTLECPGRFEVNVADLTLGADNRIERLTLMGYRPGPTTDPTLSLLPMPRLRVLDISHLRVHQGTVHAIDQALGQKTLWPVMKELVVRLKYVRRPVRQALLRLAARHGLRLTVAPWP